MKFLRNFLASILGTLTALFIVIFFFILIASSVGNDDKVIVSPNSVLELDLSNPIKDYAPKDENPFAKILDLEDPKMGLNTIINAIENAKTDSKIKGISIKTNSINAGIAQTQAIRNKLENFKESGKFVYAYNDMYSQKNYYLSSVADSVFLNPIGFIDFKGLSTEILYYKDFEDKYGVKMEVIRHGKYKSAVEPYLSNKMSDANREQTTSFLKSIWSEIIEDISKSRTISTDQLNMVADNSDGRNATKAKENNLIDASVYVDQYNEKIKNAAEVSKIKTISLADYIKSGKGRIYSTEKNKIAVIYAQGTILYGEGNEDIIGQGIINKAIKKATKDKNVKAIVLRVNSPGGDAIASELILRQIELAKKEKPILVSMGNVAASGGYYIATNASKIIAEPTTITGSIGVFGVIPNAHQFAKNIGINAEQISTNNSANYSVFEPMNEKFYTVTKEGVEKIYTTFVNRVAEGRNMTFEEVDKVAQGRVWTAKEALNIGLVDKLGSLNDAVKIAADLANVKNYRVRNYPSYKKDLKDIFKFSPFAKISKEDFIKETLGDENYRLYKNIHQMQSLKGIQMRIPFMYEIK